MSLRLGKYPSWHAVVAAGANQPGYPADQFLRCCDKAWGKAPYDVKDIPVTVSSGTNPFPMTQRSLLRHGQVVDFSGK